MKNLFLASALTALTFSTAQAADAIIYNEPVPEVPIAASFDWTGAYIGVNAGGAFGKFKHPGSLDIPGGEGPITEGFGISVTSSGFIGGAQAGYNWQSGQMIYGIEADIQGSALKGEVEFDSDVFEGAAGTKVPWFGTLRARLGYTPADRFMVYATGGLAYGKVKSYAEIDGEEISTSKTKTGWTVGAGAEYAITNNWTMKSEYLYTDLGKTTIIDDYIYDLGVKLKNDVSFHTVRVGLNYKF